jgi:hypothetical protein
MSSMGHLSFCLTMDLKFLHLEKEACPTRNLLKQVLTNKNYISNRLLNTATFFFDRNQPDSIRPVVQLNR